MFVSDRSKMGDLRDFAPRRALAWGRRDDRDVLNVKLLVDTLSAERLA